MAGKTTRGSIHVVMGDIEYFPGETHYSMSAEVPNQETAYGTVVRNLYDVIKMEKDSKVHPAIARMMILYVKNHLAQVALD